MGVHMAEGEWTSVNTDPLGGKSFKIGRGYPGFKNCRLSYLRYPCHRP